MPKHLRFIIILHLRIKSKNEYIIFNLVKNRNFLYVLLKKITPVNQKLSALSAYSLGLRYTQCDFCTFYSEKKIVHLKK